MKRKYSVIILVCLMLCMVGCGNGEEKEYSHMPEIVFLNIISYADVSDGGPQSAITFYDKEGNHYTSDDAYVCSLPFEQLLQEFENGTIADKICYHTSCDPEELLDNYNKLCSLSQDEFEIIHPDLTLDVEANEEYWYGLYYDQDGNLQYLILHERDANQGGDLYADDSRANEIYEWYLSTFQK